MQHIYLSNGGEASPDCGCGSPSYYFVYGREETKVVGASLTVHRDILSNNV
ncbi:hypothetical protein ACUH7Y_18605 [Clostridium beijerinckii]|uniref:hypothetical protein n=1 Tax=Clostridium beijerinckii TaxID=1520 RepID=UPI001459A1CF|nr:hypothetical protein [Clostridium beijerinckii]